MIQGAHGRRVRAEPRSLATHLPKEGEIASGGTDFFLAGHERTLEAGSRIGVHSWSGLDGEEGVDVPRDDPQHQLYLEYYRAMEIPEASYWFTLEAAPAAGVHWMSTSELEQFGFEHIEN